MSEDIAFDRDTLLRWAGEHRAEAARRRSRAKFELTEAREAERKAALCEREAKDATA